MTLVLLFSHKTSSLGFNSGQGFSSIMLLLGQLLLTPFPSCMSFLLSEDTLSNSVITHFSLLHQKTNAIKCFLSFISLLLLPILGTRFMLIAHDHKYNNNKYTQTNELIKIRTRYSPYYHFSSLDARLNRTCCHYLEFKRLQYIIVLLQPYVI